MKFKKFYKKMESGVDKKIEAEVEKRLENYLKEKVAKAAAYPNNAENYNEDVDLEDIEDDDDDDDGRWIEITPGNIEEFDRALAETLTEDKLEDLPEKETVFVPYSARKYNLFVKRGRFSKGRFFEASEDDLERELSRIYENDKDKVFDAKAKIRYQWFKYRDKLKLEVNRDVMDVYVDGKHVDYIDNKGRTRTLCFTNNKWEWTKRNMVMVKDGKTTADEWLKKGNWFTRLLKKATFNARYGYMC